MDFTGSMLKNKMKYIFLLWKIKMSKGKFLTWFHYIVSYLSIFLFNFFFCTICQQFYLSTWTFFLQNSPSPEPIQIQEVRKTPSLLYSGIGVDFSKILIYSHYIYICRQVLFSDSLSLLLVKQQQTRQYQMNILYV